MMPGFLQLLRAQVEARASASAIVVRGELVHSYGSLWEAAQAQAALLAESDVCASKLVGLHLYKSPAFIVGMLACWMRRAAFVPLEPTLPRERLRLMAQECDLACVLSESASLDWLGDGTPVMAASARSKAATEALPPIEPDAKDLAYLIYSSGSSGRPKGVEVMHQGLVNVLLAQIAAFGLSPDSQLLWLLSPSFDASQSDIGTALLAGAAIHIEESTLLRDPKGLLRILGERGITHLDIPPSLLRLLDVELAPKCLQNLVVGGEVCSAETVRCWAGRCRVVNVYGPTEATICTSMIQCSATSWERALIGSPIPGVVYRVVDSEGREVGVGETAELYIGGIGLARGYRMRPELDAQRFVQWQGERYFRSGDLVRVHEDGLEFVGRNDRQVKHAGVLVAPEEIEAALLSLEGVQEVAVEQERVGERSVLTAYCVLDPGASLAEIQSEIRERLPACLVPARFLRSEQLPRLLSGKVDFERLAAHDQSEGAMGPARTKREAQLMSLWASVLGVASIDREADFFQLGGDSMAVVELLVAAEDAGVALSVEQVYQHPRLADLAADTETGDASVARSCEQLQAWAAVPASLHAALAEAAKRPLMASDTGESFVTGATGFLGAHLLVELLARSEGDIILLVRARDEAEAWRRLDANLAALGLTLSVAARARCRLLLGDLQQAAMGLSKPQWLALSESIARIYHCAAAVNLLKPLELLAPVNIVGCHRLVELMCSGRRKVLHYASTLSVFVGSDRNQGVLRELDDIADVGHLHGGYAQSKWAAESFLRRCDTQAGNISYYRFGLLIGDPERGKLPQSDWLALYVRALLAAGAPTLSTSAEFSVDLTPIGYAAGAMAYLSAQNSEGSPTFHIANRCAASMRQLHEAVEKWQALHPGRGKSVASNGASAALRLGLCRAQEKYQGLRPCDLFQATGASFDCHNTLAGLAGSGIAAPLPAPQLVDAYVAKLIEEAQA